MIFCLILQSFMFIHKRVSIGLDGAGVATLPPGVIGNAHGLLRWGPLSVIEVLQT
jgi:hypothetical protein